MNIFEKFIGKSKKVEKIEKKGERKQVANSNPENPSIKERINVKKTEKDEEEAAEAAIERFKKHIRENTNPKYAHREEGETATDKDTDEKTEE